MAAEVSNPFSTGGGGGNFEAKVQASFLASMILGGSCPCMPSGSIDSIRLQSKQAEYDTDDVLVKVITPANTIHKLLGQIKHHLLFTKSNEAFRDFLFSAWGDFNSADRFDAQRDAIAIITGPQTEKGIYQIRPIFDWARNCDSADEYHQRKRRSG